MSRNKNVDVFRACALLTVIIYHCWVLTGSRPFAFSWLTNFVALGGESGVTAFFVLSGFGIFSSLDSMANRGGINYPAFMKKRFVRIAPQYYLSILVVLLIADSQYFSDYGIKSVVTHLFFVHNLFPDCAGMINGALWTMGVIVQFYIIAPILYKAFRKFGGWMLLLSIIFTVLCKYTLFDIILPYMGKSDGSVLFFAGRNQLFSVIDNFCVGMYVAWIIKYKKQKIGYKPAMIITVISVGLLILFSSIGVKYGVNTNNWSGYIWHSVVAIIIGAIVYGISYLKTLDDNWLYKKFLQLAHYEYGIYVWHLLIFYNLINHSPWVQACLNQEHVKWLYLPFTAIAIFVGVIFTNLADKKIITEKR